MGQSSIGGDVLLNKSNRPEPKKESQISFGEKSKKLK